MDIVEKFENHADECRRIARFSHDPESKLVWNRMAERWLTLAANEKARSRRLSGTSARRAHAGQRAA
jgi:hypothetical protein